MKKNIQITDSDHSSIAAKDLNTYKHSDPEDVQNDPSATICWPMQTFICRGEEGSAQDRFTLRALQPPKRAWAVSSNGIAAASRSPCGGREESCAALRGVSCPDGSAAAAASPLQASAEGLALTLS